MIACKRCKYWHTDKAARRREVFLDLPDGVGVCKRMEQEPSEIKHADPEPGFAYLEELELLTHQNFGCLLYQAHENG